MKKLYFDLETVGLMGAAKLIQYAWEEGSVHFIPMYKGWEEDEKTRALVSEFLGWLYDPETCAVGYNSATFDLFHLYRVAHRMKGLPYDSPERPVEPFRCSVIDLYPSACLYSPLAPFAFSKGASKAVAGVRSIPKQVADTVAGRVEERLNRLLPSAVELKRHYKEVKGRKDLTSVVWTVEGRLSLKNLMKEYGVNSLKLEELWPLPEKGSERQWLPYPTEVHEAVELQCDTVMSDPDSPFWKYAELDIWFLKILEAKLPRLAQKHFSECAHAIAYTRYYGFALDREVLLKTKAVYEGKVKAAEEALKGINLASSKQRLAYLRGFDPLVGSSSKKVLEVLAASDRPSAKPAKAMMDFNVYKQRLLQVEKVLESRTGRAHPSLRNMGTKTGRKAGEAGFNWQGVCQAKKGIGIRAAMLVSGVGDFSQHEVAISAVAFPDKMIAYDLENKIDAHVMNAVLMQPECIRMGWTYEQMCKLIEEGDEKAGRLRKATKAITFGLAFFAQAGKVSEVLGVSMEVAEKCLARYYERYAGFCAYKTRIEKETQTADTDRWTKDSVSKMARSVTDMTGYEMHWDFEAKVADVLWQMGGEGITLGIEGTVVRKTEKGRQTFDGAVKSALLGGAISIQSAVTRQRGNAKIQATGANINNELMSILWERFRIPILPVHDELVFASHPGFNLADVEKHIAEFTLQWKKVVPALFFDFKACKKWSDK